MHYDILDKNRLDILQYFETFKDDFYLAGGTALALQIGHRDSVDFDFFTRANFNTASLFNTINKTLSNQTILKVQEDENTLGLIINNEIKMSFMTYSYKLIKPLLNEKYLCIASLEDISCMKLSAITSRSVLKDYVDIYYLLQQFSLSELLSFASKKFSNIDIELIKKSLIYFDDVELVPILFKDKKVVDFKDIQQLLIKACQDINNL